jgi:HSP20 family protein
MTVAPRPTPQSATNDDDPTSHGPTRHGPTRHDPTREVEELQDRLGRLLASMFGDQSTDGRDPAMSVPVDIEETDGAYLVELDLPNARSEDIDVQLSDNELRVTGEVKQKERTGVLRRQTRRVGTFVYVITLPGEIDPDRVGATLIDGVLTIRVGKGAASRARHIEIQGD